MYETKSESLRVPGANLHWTVRGTGLVLLMIPGGARERRPPTRSRMISEPTTRW